MLIAIDYDETYTRDPDFWDQVIGLGEERGHQFVCVTGRHEREPVSCALATIYTDGEYKRFTCRKRGIHPDIWIDDAPGFIEPGRVLAW